MRQVNLAHSTRAQLGGDFVPTKSFARCTRQGTFGGVRLLVVQKSGDYSSKRDILRRAVIVWYFALAAPAMSMSLHREALSTMDKECI
jgi:hypothetical protein